MEEEMKFVTKLGTALLLIALMVSVLPAAAAQPPLLQPSLPALPSALFPLRPAPDYPSGNMPPAPPSKPPSHKRLNISQYSQSLEGNLTHYPPQILNFGEHLT